MQLWHKPGYNLGASGAVNAIVMFSILLNPYATYLIYGVVPAPAWALGIGWLAYDLYGATKVCTS
jgi:rhomboid-like protein